MLCENILDVLSINESKLNDSFPHDQFAVPQYKVYRKDYKINEGGLMLFLRHDLPQFRRNDLEEKFNMNNENGRIELLAVEVKIKSEKWIFISMYKQPKVKHVYLTDTIDNIMLNLVQYESNIVILGDLNINMMKHNLLSDCLHLNGLTNIIKDATCFKGAPSIIDLVITNKPKRFNDTICADAEVSDFHYMTCTATKFNIPKLKPITFKYRSYKYFDETSFLNDLERIPYYIIDVFDDINDSYWAWNKLTMDVIDEHAPMKTRTIKGNRVPYMNGNLRKAINVKHMLKRKYDKNDNSSNWNKYRKQRNLVTKLRKHSINNYIKNKCNSNKCSNSREFWTCVKPLISHRNNYFCDNIIISVEDTVYTDPLIVSTMFNDYFTNIAKNIGFDDCFQDKDDVISCFQKHKDHTSIKNIKTLLSSRTDKSQFSFNEINEIDVKKAMNKLDIKKASGYDMLPPKLANLGSATLSVSLCHLINLSIKSCTFPDQLKCAQIRPIYKKGNNLEISNYRPVSVLPCISKSFEKIIVTQMSNYFENIFHEFLSGFRAKHGCESVLLHMTEYIKSCLDDGKIVCVIITDLSRAFDCIPYKLFIAKLHAYGFSESACRLLFSYYTNRKQQVKLGNVLSDWQHVFKGSAQGSVIGPVSYNIFANDVLSILDDDIKKYNYADDNSLLCSGYNYEDIKLKLITNVEKFITWFEDNGMKINPGKFKYIVFGKHDNVEDIVINDIIIKPESTVKILGLTIDNKLSFNSHIVTLCQKAGRQIQALSRLSHMLNENNKMLLYNSFIECYFNFCSIIWHFCSKNNTYKLEKLQKKAIRYVTLDYNCNSYKSLLNKCNKHPMYIKRIHRMMELMFKIQTDASPDYLKDFILLKKTNFNLRNENVLSIPKFKTIMYGQRSFRYYGLFYWNELLKHVNTVTSLNEFKQVLNAWQPKCTCGFCTLCKISNM